MKKRIAVIGAGAAGLMCCARLLESEKDFELYLFEKNPILGRKVIISGGGRCNVTSGIRDIKEVLKKYPRGKRFLQFALHQFGPKEIYDWFEKNGVKLKTEDDLRVFPVSNNGKDIVNVFEKIFEDARINILYKSQADSIDYHNGFKINGDIFDFVVLATGGKAYRHTGSTGDGYDFAEKLGHKITKLAPSLNSFIVKEKWLKELAGRSFLNVKMEVKTDKKHAFEGPIVFTHKGISGPAAFAMSSLICFENYSEKYPIEMRLDFLPELNEEELRSKFKFIVQQEGKKNAHNIVNRFVINSFAQSICEHLEIDKKKANELSKKDINRVIDFLKNCKVQLIGRAAGDEFVTAGGVELKEVDKSTMQSKICTNLYFAGELLDIDGFTGGFNLSASWATGRLAAEDILSKL